MGKGDQKSKRGKIISGSYGKKRPRKSASVKNIPVNVLDEDDNKSAKTKVRKEVGYPADKSENADVKKEPKAKAAAKPKAEKTEEKKPADKKAEEKNKSEDIPSEEPKEEKPKAPKAKKTEE